MTPIAILFYFGGFIGVVGKPIFTSPAMLAGVFILLLGPPVPKPDRLKDGALEVRQISSTVNSFSLLSYFSPLYLPILLLINFSFFCAFLVHI